MSMIDTIKADIENYKKQIQAKREQIEQAQQQIRQLDAEAVLLNGALQQCEKLLKVSEADGSEEKVEKVDSAKTK